MISLVGCSKNQSNISMEVRKRKQKRQLIWKGQGMRYSNFYWNVWCVYVIVFVLFVLCEKRGGGVDGLSISTFNLLAPIHRTYCQETKERESEREEWWVPRCTALAHHIGTDEVLKTSDIVLLQEWWFHPKFVSLFTNLLQHQFDIYTEYRHYPTREDGMAILVNKHGSLQAIQSHVIPTGPTRIGQLLECIEKESNTQKRRKVHVANVHLSFPSHSDARINERRQAYEMHLIVRAMKQCLSPTSTSEEEDVLEIIGGDFNSNSQGLAAQILEQKYQFINAASASAIQSYTSGSGGQVQLGITHQTHCGTHVSVDHIFCKSPQTRKQKQNLFGTQWGYLDSKGTCITRCQRGSTYWFQNTTNTTTKTDNTTMMMISDHLPVTVDIHWPIQSKNHHSNTDKNDTTDGDLNFFPSPPNNYTIWDENDSMFLY